MAILKKGMAGEPVRRLQTKLGVKADGIFGPNTETALKDYQKRHGLKVDGIAGPDSFMQMGLYELVLLKRGTSGETVKRLQVALGLVADGKFGAGTEKAVMEFQTKNGLAADGMAGPLTLEKMQEFKEMTASVVSQSRVGKAIVDAWHAITGGDKEPDPAKVPAAPQPVASAEVASSRSIWETIKGIFK